MYKKLLTLISVFSLILIGALVSRAQEATPGPGGGMDMEMDTGYSVDDLAPLALAYYEGGIGLLRGRRSVFHPPGGL